MTDYISKPIDTEVFEKKLIQYLDEIENRSELKNYYGINLDKDSSLESDLAKNISLNEARHMEENNFDSIDLPIWDEADALKRVMGKEKILKVLIASFLSDMPGYAKTLADDLARKDIEAASKSAHALKGVAGNLSTLALAEITKKIELACRGSASLEEVLPLYTLFEEAFQKSCDTLSAWQALHD
jgi:HPt (histidine-containing phosphotransfer) domain-containing protein